MPTLFEAPPRHPSKKQIRVVGKKKELLPMHVFSTFAYKPKGVHFETQEEGEEVLLFLRQHIILLLPWMILSLFLLVVPTIGLPMLIHFLPKPIVIPNGHMIVGTMFWYLAVFGFFLTKVIHWFFNIFIVTNERIVDIDFVNLLYKEFSEAKVTRIQDMSYQTKGVFATFFNFGDVLIQTAGEVPNFVFESVPKPAYVVDTISDLIKGVKNTDL